MDAATPTITRAVLDADAFTQAYPIDLHPHLYKVIPDAQAIKATLNPADLAAVTRYTH